jgi:ABC-2 type transport system permease protein
MKNVIPVTQRELAACFYSPIAYVTGFLFLLATGLYFILVTLAPGAEASMRPLFEVMAVVLVFVVPLLTMRTVSEELSSGTIETLMTAPVTEIEVILGKFLGVMLFYIATLATTGLYLGLIVQYSEPEVGLIVFGYLGMILLGGLYIAVGIFTSACTRHQLLAAVLSASILAGMTILADEIGPLLPDIWHKLLAQINIFEHFEDFAKGVFDTSALVYFVSATVFFLFLAARILESRRWR